jgi:hypothetical protein
VSKLRNEISSREVPRGAMVVSREGCASVARLSLGIVDESAATACVNALLTRH